MGKQKRAPVGGEVSGKAAAHLSLGGSAVIEPVGQHIPPRLPCPRQDMLHRLLHGGDKLILVKGGSAQVSKVVFTPLSEPYIQRYEHLLDDFGCGQRMLGGVFPAEGVVLTGCIGGKSPLLGHLLAQGHKLRKQRSCCLIFACLELFQRIKERWQRKILVPHELRHAPAPASVCEPIFRFQPFVLAAKLILPGPKGGSFLALTGHPVKRVDIVPAPFSVISPSIHQHLFQSGQTILDGVQGAVQLCVFCLALIIRYVLTVAHIGKGGGADQIVVCPGLSIIYIYKPLFIVRCGHIQQRLVQDCLYLIRVRIRKDHVRKGRVPMAPLNGPIVS